MIADFDVPIVCAACDTPIPTGTPYSDRLDSVDEAGVVWTTVVCPGCEVAG